jgi:chaperonin GroEL
MRRIVLNSGFEETPILEHVRAAGPGHGFDVLAGEVRKMVEAGIYDPTRVVRFALETGVSGALMGVTTEALILRKHSEHDIAVNP